jgi:hypothetical protein
LRAYTKFVANPGDKFDHWTVLGPGESAKYSRGTLSSVKVRCVCGVEKEVLTQSLRDRKSKSCGCRGKIIPRQFDIFGQLWVNSSYYDLASSSWKVHLFCQCGQGLIRPVSDLLKKKDPLRSCGCKGRIFSDTEAQCSSCREILLHSEFPPSASKQGGLNTKCRKCNKSSELLRNFNITLAQYQHLLEFQDNVCALCEETETVLSGTRLKNFAVDHDHSCCPSRGKSCGTCIRGLLCQSCNTSLGFMEKKLKLRKLFAAYLSQQRLDLVNKILKEIDHEPVGLIEWSLRRRSEERS